MATPLINIIEMDLKRISFARQFLPASGAAIALLLLCGCATMGLTNLTPSSLPQNPSGIYTFTLRATAKSTTVVPDSIAPHVVVGEQSHDMRKSDTIPGIYEFDYKLPPGQDVRSKNKKPKATTDKPVTESKQNPGFWRRNFGRKSGDK